MRGHNEFLDPPYQEASIHPAEEEICCILEGEVGEAEKQKILALLEAMNTDAGAFINRLEGALDAAQHRIETLSTQLVEAQELLTIARFVQGGELTYKGQFGSKETYISFWGVQAYDDDEEIGQLSGTKYVTGDTYEDCLRNIRDGKAVWLDDRNQENERLINERKQARDRKG